MTRARLGLALAALAVSLAYLGAEAWLLDGSLGFALDDSWIHLQFARNLAAGDGLSFNPGELVTGSTAPLWTALLSLLFLIPGSVIAWTKVLGIALHVVGVDATWRLARELGLSSGLAALAAGLTLSTSWLAWSALSGMEIPLFILLSVWGVLLHLRERASPGKPPLSLAILAVSVLARPEGLLLLLLAALDRVLTFGPPLETAASAAGGERLAWRRPALTPLLTGSVLAVCALLGPLLFYGWAGDSVLPTTYAAKGAGGFNALPNLQYVWNAIGILFRPQPLMTLLAAGGAAALVSRLGTERDRGLLPALWVAGLPLAYGLLAPAPTRLLGNFGRYYFPLFPFVIVLGVLALEPAARALGPRLRALAVLGLLLPSLGALAQGAIFHARNVANVEDSDVAVARWLAPRLPAEAVLAVNDIGAIKYLLPNRIVDLASIATPEIRREVARATAAGTPWDLAMVQAIERRQPDYVVIFPSWVPGVARDPRFRPVHVVRIPGNITMGGDEIVVYETPWTRHPLRAVPGNG